MSSSVLAALGRAVCDGCRGRALTGRGSRAPDLGEAASAKVARVGRAAAGASASTSVAAGVGIVVGEGDSPEAPEDATAAWATLPAVGAVRPVALRREKLKATETTRTAARPPIQTKARLRGALLDDPARADIESQADGAGVTWDGTSELPRVARAAGATLTSGRSNEAADGDRRGANSGAKVSRACASADASM